MFHITRNIWQGRFASPQRLSSLQRNRITHIVNVGESPNQLVPSDGPFARVDWIPIEDLVVIPVDSAIKCIDAIHNAVCDDSSNVYIHCVAGWNRSPTVLCLYFMACGIEQNDANHLITLSSFDAVPSHPKLINESLVKIVRQHGLDNYLPHPRLDALDAVDHLRNP